MQPKQSSFENLKKAILDWETELAQYELSAGPGTSMLEKDRVMCLEDMCPDILQQHLESKENIHTYAEYKLAIYDYLANRVRWTERNQPFELARLTRRRPPGRRRGPHRTRRTGSRWTSRSVP